MKNEFTGSRSISLQQNPALGFVYKMLIKLPKVK